ncbi:MAG: DinB family protein [candidate division NC10 bacterium]|nr:DinB family protein [candidate division NC10 bacterium]
MRRATLLALAVLAAVPPALAQAPASQTPAEYQLRMLEHQRKLLLAMADSMPERLYRDRATPEQRDFAQQIHHAAVSAAFIASTTMKAPKLALPDTAAAFVGRAGLRGFVTAAYDYCGALLRGQDAAARAETVDLFGQGMPRWQVWDEIHTHTVWTAGQAVANFRKHGMAPPAFTFF